MLTHDQVWTALDRLAERAGLSASGLAKKSGLDPTTFNKSKRVTADGRERWPSTESVAKALAATNSSIDSFVQLIGDTARTAQSVPLLGFAQAGAAALSTMAAFRPARAGTRSACPRSMTSTPMRWKFPATDEAGLSRRRRHRGVAGARRSGAATAWW